MTARPPICDYEGSDYRTRFWEGQGRNYEDRVERIALRRLMPTSGGNLIDIGAGFGRLADEYRGYERVVLFDYSVSLLQEARERLAGDERLLFVAGDWYKMPFVDNLFEALVQVRTIHHAADVPALFAQLARIARPQGTYILEFANKRHLKSIVRYCLRRQEWSPFQQAPLEFTDLNFDFHPRWMREQLLTTGFTPQQTLTVSHFRSAMLKRLAPTKLLVLLDSLAQWTGGLWQLTPSVFMRNRSPAIGYPSEEGQFFACPQCLEPLNDLQGDMLSCKNPACGKQWSFVDGIYNFKDPV